MTQHDFRRSLALSESYSEAPWWEEVYRGAFPGFLSMSRVKEDGWGQRGGVDRVVNLSSGKSLWVDEKVRTEAYSDILLEVWSDKARRVPGWVQKDLACDYIAYAFVPLQHCYLLPFLTLRQCWEREGKIWWHMAKERLPGHRIVQAPNRGYTTESVTVPIETLLDALKDAMCVSWGGAPLPRYGQQVMAGVIE